MISCHGQQTHNALVSFNLKQKKKKKKTKDQMLLSINLTKCDSYNIPHDCSYKFTLYIIILNLNIKWWQVHKYIEWAWVFYLKIILNFD
jgi:hypothetical protein